MSTESVYKVALNRIRELEDAIVILKRDVNRAQLRNASVAAQMRMLTDQRDSWLPWWFRQAFFKFMRRHFPLTGKFLKQYVIEDYMTPELQTQMHAARREDQKREKERNKREGRNNKGVHREQKPQAQSLKQESSLPPAEEEKPAQDGTRIEIPSEWIPEEGG